MTVNAALYKAERYRSYLFPLVKPIRMPFSPSRSGYKFGYKDYKILEAILSSCMARANDTCNVPPRENSDIDSTTFPSFSWVERRRSGPNRISRSAAITKFVISRAMCHWHVPSGTKHIAIDFIILLSSFQAEQSLSGPNPFGRSSTRSKRVKTRVMCQ